MYDGIFEITIIISYFCNNVKVCQILKYIMVTRHKLKCQCEYP